MSRRINTGFKSAIVFLGVILFAFIAFLVVSVCLTISHGNSNLIDEWKSWGQQDEQAIEDEQTSQDDEADDLSDLEEEIDSQIESLQD